MGTLKVTLRALRKSPGFTAIAVGTLALGIGANTAIFSLVNAVILKPLPYRDPGRLIAVWDTYRPQFDKIGISPVELAAWQQSDVFSETAWYRSVPQNLALTAPGQEAQEVHAGIISAGLLPLLGVGPVLGRSFTESEAPGAALLSYTLWRTRFAGDPGIVGKTIRLSDQDYTVTGVMPAGFQFPEFADVWLPKGPLAGDELTNPVRHAMGFLGRLRPGVSREQAGARIRSAAARLAAEHPRTSKGWGVQVFGLQEDLTAKMRPALLMLLGAVALVLLIACANVANLLLSRAASRGKEIALRTALGAGAGHLIRQLLTESLVLTGLGGAAGLALAAWALRTFSPVAAPLDTRVLLFLLAVCAATGVIFGLVPALQVFQADPGQVIKSGQVWERRTGFAAGPAALVIAEFALALVLAAGAGILAKSFLRLMNVNPGFDPNGVLTMRISAPPGRDAAVFRRIQDGVRALPGVESVAAANALPLVANRAFTSRFHVPGSALINPDAPPAAQLRVVSPDYFHAMRIPLVSGRAFTERDVNGAVVIINETLARRFWPGRDPVGVKFVTGPWGPNPAWSTIIGVAGDVKQFGLDSEATMDLYFPALASNYLIVRTAGGAEPLAAPIRRLVASVDGGMRFRTYRR